MLQELMGKTFHKSSISQYEQEGSGINLSQESISVNVSKEVRKQYQPA